jgi:dolichol kinase
MWVNTQQSTGFSLWEALRLLLLLCLWLSISIVALIWKKRSRIMARTSRISKAILKPRLNTEEEHEGIEAHGLTLGLGK